MPPLDSFKSENTLPDHEFREFIRSTEKIVATVIRKLKIPNQGMTQELKSESLIILWKIFQTNKNPEPSIVTVTLKSRLIDYMRSISDVSRSDYKKIRNGELKMYQTQSFNPNLHNTQKIDGSNCDGLKNFELLEMIDIIEKTDLENDERKILMGLLKGRQAVEISKEMGLSQPRISQILKIVRQKIKDRADE